MDLGALEQWPTNTIPGFVEALLEMLPGVGEHSCSLGRRGGFRERLAEGTWLGHVAEHIAIELQRESGAHVYRGKTRSAGEPGRYNVIYGYWEERVGVAAGELAVRLVNHLVAPSKGFDFLAELEKLILLAERRAFGPSTQAILDEAASRDIPFIRLNEASLVQLGWGKYQQRIRATMTSKTSALAVDIAGDKDMTRQLLAAAGLPVPRGEIVRSEDDAAAAAARIGLPVVTKPLDGNHGRGVGLDLRDEARRSSGVQARGRRGSSRPGGRGDLRDRQRLPGARDRRTDGRRRRARPRARDRRRRAHRGRAGRAHEPGPTARDRAREGVDPDQGRRRGRRRSLGKHGFAIEDVPEPEAFVKLAATGNMSTGGISIDRTWEAHEENVEIAEEAARVVGLDVAGIDFLAPDITQPVRETGGAIVEVNAAPGFRMHTHPTEGEPQYVAKHVVDLLFPPGTPARIPIVAVTGSNGKTTTTRMISHIFKGMGRHVGITSTDGIYIDERLVQRVDASGPKSAQMVLQNPRVDFAVFEVARGGILREGLGYGRNDVAVVLNVTGDHLGLKGIETLEQLAAVKQVLVEAVPKNGFAVLNADDPLVAEMRKACSGSVILFSMQEKNELVERWVRRGGKAVVLEKQPRGEMMVIREGRRNMPIAWVHTLPATFEGRARMMVQNAMAAAAAAHAAGAHLHDIRQGLRSFTTSIYQAPGRLNVFDLDGVKVLIDYAHNAAGTGDARRLRRAPDGRRSRRRPARRGLVGREPAGGRRGDGRRPSRRGHARARAGRRALLRRHDHPRGPQHARAQARRDGRAGRWRASAKRWPRGPVPGYVEVVPDEMDATRKALDRSRPGDLVVLCVDYATEVFKELEARRSLAADSPIFLPPEGNGRAEGVDGDPDLLGV